jgi:predicted NBD/HSP70 family sugar kinase
MAALSVLTVLRVIKERGTASRTQLQQVTGLSWGTVTNTTRDLLRRNFIRETGAVDTKAGRKPMRLAINPDSHVLVGVDLVPELLRCVALSLTGETLFAAQRSFAADTPPCAVLDLAAELVREAAAAVPGRRRLGVGLAAPGAVDAGAGVMRFAPQMPNWQNVPVRAYLSERLGEAVRVEHDPNCLALAERWFGAASADDDVVCVMLGDGVGMGILLGGEVYRGAQQMAGEFGHMTIEVDGAPCACGDRGCVEAYASVGAVIAATRAGAQPSEALQRVLAARDPTVAELVSFARQGDPAARGAFERMGRYLGLAIANTIDLLNPSLVVLCGPLAVAADLFTPAMQEQTRQHAWRHSTQRVVTSHLGQNATAIGACGMVLQGLFGSDAEAAATEVETARG